MLKMIFRPFLEKEIIPLESERIELNQDWGIVFARCFSTPDGKKVLAYLKHIHLEKAMGMEAEEAMLRYQEGRRSLVLQILSLVKQGQRR